MILREIGGLIYSITKNFGVVLKTKACNLFTNLNTLHLKHFGNDFVIIEHC